jgi:hypothetical protein
MLSLFDRPRGGRLSRRELLSIGSLGLAGLTLPQLLMAKRARGASGNRLSKDRAVVLLYLGGGPSQFETFDPKMTAPSNIRSVTGEVQTALPGVTFGGSFPMLGARAKKLSILRSLGHRSSDHGASMRIMNCGLAPDAEETGAAVEKNAGKYPMMWEIVSRVRGITNSQTGLPTSLLIVPKAAAPGDKGKGLRAGDDDGHPGSGAFGPAYKAFNPAGRSDLLNNMQLSLPVERIDDRRALLRGLDRLRRDVDASGHMDAIDTYGQQAVDLLLGGAAKAFHLDDEDPATLAAYDTSEFVLPSNLPANERRDGNPAFLGRQMLMARRLVESGAGFVKVLSYAWDMHKFLPEKFPAIGGAVDKAASAFIDDCERRGLGDKVLLVIMGEMGRTPGLDKTGGRDHWGNITPVALYGGGLKTGQVIGQSDNRGAFPVGTGYTPPQLMTTVMHTLFDLAELRIVPGLPTDVVSRIVGSQPIPELV